MHLPRQRLLHYLRPTPTTKPFPSTGKNKHISNKKGYVLFVAWHGICCIKAALWLWKWGCIAFRLKDKSKVILRKEGKRKITQEWENEQEQKNKGRKREGKRWGREREKGKERIKWCIDKEKAKNSLLNAKSTLKTKMSRTDGKKYMEGRKNILGCLHIKHCVNFKWKFWGKYFST